MAAKTTAEHKAALAEFGVDWDKIMALNWMQFFAFIRSLIDAFRSKTPPVFGAGHAGCAADCKAHFECIAAVAACGVECCNGC